MLFSWNGKKAKNQSGCSPANESAVWHRHGNNQYSKTLDAIPAVDMVVTMGCNVDCPYLPCMFREDWGLNDPTGKSDAEFVKVIRVIEARVLELNTYFDFISKNNKNW